MCSFGYMYSYSYSWASVGFLFLLLVACWQQKLKMENIYYFQDIPSIPNWKLLIWDTSSVDTSIQQRHEQFLQKLKNPRKSSTSTKKKEHTIQYPSTRGTRHTCTVQYRVRVLYVYSSTGTCVHTTHHTHTYMYRLRDMYVKLHVCMYVCMYVCEASCMYHVCMYVCMYHVWMCSIHTCNIFIHSCTCTVPVQVKEARELKRSKM